MFSSHHLHQVQYICDCVGLFVDGKLIASGDIQGLSNELFAKSAIVIDAKVSVPVNPSSKNGKQSA